MSLFPLLSSVLSFSRKFKDIEGQLQFWSGESTTQQPIDRTQNLKESSELLERLRETIFDYQVRS